MSIPPFRLRFENNDSFEHRERRWIGRGIGASHFAQDMIEFRKIHQDLTRKLQKFLQRAGIQAVAGMSKGIRIFVPLAEVGANWERS
jgi:hypothetical protein